MRTLLLCHFLLAGLISWALATPIRSLARRRRLVDRNEGRGAIAYREIPRIGGVSFALAFAIAYGLSRLSGVAVASDAALADWRIWVTAAATFGIGFWDDIRSVRAQYKLAALLMAGGLVSASGHGITALPGGAQLGPIGGAVATALWFTAVGTAWNFVDGLDGLATGLSIIGLFALALSAPAHALGPLLLAGAAAGFFAHNRHPATIFMGDSGSFFFGFWIALFAIDAGQGGGDGRAVSIALLAVAWPLADLAWATSGRLLRRSLFAASSDHLHYLLCRRLGHATAVETILACAGTLALAGLARRGALVLLDMAVCLLLIWACTARNRRSVPALVAAAYVAISLTANFGLRS